MSDNKNLSEGEPRSGWFKRALAAVGLWTPATGIEASEKSSDWLDTLRTIVYAVLIALGIRSVAYEPFNIPSESMLPTLLVGDYLFVAKYAYGFSKHSLPMSPPLFSGRIFESPVKRGDVVVFKLPSDNKTDYIKRIVGVPGDILQMRDGVLYINRKAVKKQRIDDFPYRILNGVIYKYPRFHETLPNGVKHQTLDIYLGNQGDNDNTRLFEVPEGFYFAMGDNRDNSIDSRVTGGVGLIPAENLVGRAEFIFHSTNGEAAWWEFWKWPKTIRFERLFTGIND